MKFYIYEIATKKVVEVVECGESDCPTDGLEYDWEIYGGTYTPAFGSVDGLVE